MIRKLYKQVSILLVEDDDIDAMGIQRAFKHMEIANPIHHAHDGIEGLELLRSGLIERPCIILLDLNMPRMGGIEMLGELRKDPALSDNVVFVLTTSKFEEDKSAAYNEHIAGYILKSDLGTNFNKLVQMLDRYWGLVELPTN